jgi:hypothetical protein
LSGLGRIGREKVYFVRVVSEKSKYHKGKLIENLKNSINKDGKRN